MPEKFVSADVSPLRNNANFLGRNNGNKVTTKRTATKKTTEKLIDDRKTELKNTREGRDEIAASSLNLTLVGSPAPRSQVRALVSSTTVPVNKSKVKPACSAKSREQNAQDISMEKLYQFADNPTKFVLARSEDRAAEAELKLDLKFSDRSDESENYYNSHNIAFGENGEYRIPEYDHIRFLQFSIGEPQDAAPATEGRDNSASVKLDRSRTAESCSGSVPDIATNDESLDGRLAQENLHVSAFPDYADDSGSLDTDVEFNLSDAAASRKADSRQWNPKTRVHASNWSIKSASPVLEVAPSYPLGSAINYKININPEVEKFMLGTGVEALDEKYASKVTRINRLVEESILSKNFAQAVRLQPLVRTVENSSVTAPETSRTTLSQTSSADGTWHGHSLNSPYFASSESNSPTESKRPASYKRDSSKRADCRYEETDEYLTIVRNERSDSAPTADPDDGGGHSYIFITDQFIDQGTAGMVSPEFSKRSQSTTESDGDSVAKMDRQSPEFGKLPYDANCNTYYSSESTSDYCIGDMFFRSSVCPTNSSSASSAIGGTQIGRTESSATYSHSIRYKSHEERLDAKNDFCTAEVNTSEVELKESLIPKVFYMTMEEVNLAADYTGKLAQIFNRVLERYASKERAHDTI